MQVDGGVAHGTAYAGPKRQDQTIIDEFRSLGDPIFDMSDLIPDYRAFQAGFDPLSTDLLASPAAAVAPPG